jgi:hypothetical protein
VRIPLPFAVKQEETSLIRSSKATVQCLDAASGSLEHDCVLWHLPVGCIGEVAEYGEVNPRPPIGQSRHFQTLDKFVDLGHGREQRGNDDHRSGIVRDPVLQLETDQPARLNEQRDEALHDHCRDLAGRNEQQQADPKVLVWSAAVVAGVGETERN